MRSSLRLLTALLLPVALATACGDDEVATGDQGSGTDGGGSAGGGTTATVPEGTTPGGLPGDVFLSVEYVGGFVPQGFDFRSVPAATIYADGTVVAPGATTLQFPGPAVAPLATGTLDDGDLGELLDAVAAAGLLADVPPDPGTATLVADAATTRITVVVDGHDTVVEAYALGDFGGGDFDDPGISEEQQEVRDRLSELVADITNAATNAATDPYEPAGYRVLAFDSGGAEGIEPAPNHLTWPAGLEQPAVDECLALTGDAATAFAAALDDATETTIWTIDSGDVSLSIRPMLPHEDGC